MLQGKLQRWKSLEKQSILNFVKTTLEITCNFHTDATEIHEGPTNENWLLDD